MLLCILLIYTHTNKHLYKYLWTGVPNSWICRRNASLRHNACTFFCVCSLNKQIKSYPRFTGTTTPSEIMRVRCVVCFCFVHVNTHISFMSIIHVRCVLCFVYFLETHTHNPPTLMYAQTHTHTHTFIYTHIHIHSYTHTYTHIHTRTHTHTHTRTHTPSHFLCHSLSLPHTHTHTNAHTLSLTHTHSHTHRQLYTPSLYFVCLVRVVFHGRHDDYVFW